MRGPERNGLKVRLHRMLMTANRQSGSAYDMSCMNSVDSGQPVKGGGLKEASFYSPLRSRPGPYVE